MSSSSSRPPGQARPSLDSDVVVSPNRQVMPDELPNTGGKPKEDINPSSVSAETPVGEEPPTTSTTTVRPDGVLTGSSKSSSSTSGTAATRRPSASPASAGSNSVRSRLLNLIGDIKLKLSQLEDFSGEQLPLTQFVICGGQSAGKSRLVETLAGATFNFVSGTLGSRRPTVVEFRSDKTLTEPRWYLLKQSKNPFEPEPRTTATSAAQRPSTSSDSGSPTANSRSADWQRLPLAELQARVSRAHEELGNSVSADPIYVRLESSHCVDMQVVDLPGFRDFSDNPDKQVLADKIDTLVTGFMRNPRNIMLCVEPSGDAANLKTLGRCKKLDPNFERTILIRTKLDKYYTDLSPMNINSWFEGFGDLPKVMPKFALSLPFWREDTAESDRPPFLKLREAAVERDLSTCVTELGLKPELHRYCGYENMAHSLERIIERRFASEVKDILDLLEAREKAYTDKRADFQRELASTGDPADFLKTIRGTGGTYARALCDIMHGSLHSHVGRTTLADELMDFEHYSKIKGLTPDRYDVVPSEDFRDLNEYIDYLGGTGRCPGFSSEINGGAQFLRLLYEIEVYFRFLDIQHNVTEREIIQSRGVGTTEVAWIDSIVKLIRLHGPTKTRRAVDYVSERLKWFFTTQKESILQFMLEVRGTCDSHLYSRLLYEKALLMKENQTIKKLIFDRFDSVVERHQQVFHSLVNRTIDSMLQKPSALLKGSSMPSISRNEELDTLLLPTKSDTIQRIHREFSDRGKLDMYLKRLIASIPDNNLAGSDVVEKVTGILVTTFAFVRSFIADELELFAVSFYQLPMLRRLEADMHEIVLDEDSRAEAETRKAALEGEIRAIDAKIGVVQHCIKNIKTFRRCCSVG
ncbi:unnamed protein product [Amoebophrya sp. A25]|nr:unnamed protein product [Amoebophrya sp. A25]|eukprot:GSA25T00008687001.1